MFKLQVVFTRIIFSLRNIYLGKGVRIQRNSVVTRSSIGKYSYIGDFCRIDKAKIGDYTSIAPGVQIGGMEHPYKDLAMNTVVNDNWVKKETIIGNDVWIGSKAIIRQGVVIGDGAVIGAGALVLKDVKEYSIVLGVLPNFKTRSMKEQHED